MALISIFVALANNGFYQDLSAQPTIKDSRLKSETVADNLSSPTSMGFVGSNVLVLEKNGSVRLISNGILEDEPVLRVKVQTDSERGLLGITTWNNDVFLYFTELVADGSLKNRVYRYEWNGKNLIEQALILDLPALPGPNHDGGKLLIDQPKDRSGPNLYAVICDLNHNGVLQNIKGGENPMIQA
jgi:aldose sugar dehydrogenase